MSLPRIRLRPNLPTTALRVPADLFNQINAMLPVQSFLQKYFASRLTQIKSTSFAIPFR